jgi:hypothetical protein
MSTIIHKSVHDQFFYEMAIRKSLVRTCALQFNYARQLYALPVSKLTNLGSETRFAYFVLLQLNLAKLFVNRHTTHKYNLHELLRQLQTGSFSQLGMPADQVLALANRLAGFHLTIESIQFARDKWLAHTDHLGGIAPTNTFFPSIERLLVFGFELLDACSQSILGTPVPNTISMDALPDMRLLKDESDTADDPF